MKKIMLSLAISLQASIVFAASAYSLDFNPNTYTVKTLTYEGKQFHVRAYENIVYVKSPVDINYQILNVYVLMEYYENKTVNGYTEKTAPIFFPNSVGGYMPAKPLILEESQQVAEPPQNGKLSMPPMMGMRNNASLAALQQGFIVVAPGARGRTTQDKKNEYTGKAPASIVDLKAAVRYLHYNDAVMPGDAHKIISNGTSAGGALSALLGASGNHVDYEPYLKKLGAAEAKDDIFAVSAYCPITNLDHADMAYEWLLANITHYKKLVISGNTDWNIKRKMVEGDLTADQRAIAIQLKDLFPSYLNSLGLKKSDGTHLTLDKNGEGSFKEYVQSFVVNSAQKALESGKDMSAYPWLSIANNRITAIDFEQYLQYMGRMKTPPAFDALDVSSGENNLFGTDKINNQHFTSFGLKNDTAKGTFADAHSIKMMNPMEYIGSHGATVSKYWRVRHGTIDKDTSLAISVILATKLQNNGYDVNFELPWDKPHSGDYDLDELFEWANTICRK